MSIPDLLPVTSQLCERCSGEGQIYTSRYGWNDPDVWPIGKCSVCDGTGYEPIETDEIDEEDVFAMNDEMMAALQADGEKLRSPTGEDHGPHFIPEPGSLQAAAVAGAPNCEPPCPECGHAPAKPIEARHAFLNRLRSLHNIDRDQLPELDNDEWRSFRDDPVRFFMRADYFLGAAIWREVEKRQRVTA